MEVSIEVTHFGQLNIVFGWVWIVLGILSGSLIGMWAFDGPFKPPRNHKNYDDLSRRLVRLAHIACFMLPLICVVYGMHIDNALLPDNLKLVGSYGMIICMIGVPTLLVAASFKIEFKYLEVIPVSAGIVSFMIMAWGQYQTYINL